MTLMRRRRGYALRDLLVILAVNVALAGLLVFAVQKVRSEAARMKARPASPTVHYKVIPVPRTTPVRNDLPASTFRISAHRVVLAHADVLP